MASKFALTLVFTGTLFLAGNSVQAASELVSPPRIDHVGGATQSDVGRPIDTGAEAPYVPVTNAELLGQMSDTTTNYSESMIASSGNEAMYQVPPGSPPYR